MKCIFFLDNIPKLRVNIGAVYRVKNDVAKILVKQGKAEYVCRSRWRNHWGDNRKAGYLYPNF